MTKDITDKMIEAGQQVFKDLFGYGWNNKPDTTEADLVADIYKAMKAKEPVAGVDHAASVLRRNPLLKPGCIL